MHLTEFKCEVQIFPGIVGYSQVKEPVNLTLMVFFTTTVLYQAHTIHLDQFIT